MQKPRVPRITTTWNAASAVALIQPDMTAAMVKDPDSNDICNATGHEVALTRRNAGPLMRPDRKPSR